MRYILSFFSLLLVILIVVFVVLNSHVVPLNYYLGNTRIYLPLLLFLTLFAGSILGIFAMLPLWFRAKRERRKMKNRLLDREAELKNLRHIPIKDVH